MEISCQHREQVTKCAIRIVFGGGGEGEKRLFICGQRKNGNLFFVIEVFDLTPIVVVVGMSDPWNTLRQVLVTCVKE